MDLIIEIRAKVAAGEFKLSQHAADQGILRGITVLQIREAMERRAVVSEMRYDNDERLVDRLVTYTIEYQGRVVIIENVPARVDPETGEQFFSPETVEQLQAIVWSDREPDRVAQTPVFQFAA